MISKGLLQFFLAFFLLIGFSEVVATELVRQLPIQVYTAGKKTFTYNNSKLNSRAIRALKDIVTRTPIQLKQTVAAPHDGQKIKAMALSSDGKTLIVGGSRGEDDNLRAYFFLKNVNADGSLGEGSTSTFQDKDISIISLAVSPYDKKIAAVCHTNKAVSNFNDILLTSFEDGTIEDPVSIHTVKAKKMPKSLMDGDARQTVLKTMSAVAFSPNGKIMVAGGLKNKLYVWKCEADNTINPQPQVVEDECGEINTIAFSADGRRMATASNGDHNFLLWSVSDDGIIDSNQEIQHHSYFRGCRAALTSDGKKLATATEKEVVLWDIHDIDNIKEQGRATFPEWQQCDSLAFSHDNKKMIIHGKTESHGYLMFCEISDFKRFQTVYTFPYYREVFEGSSGRVRFYFKNRSNIGLFSPDNRQIIAAVGDSLRVFDISDRQLTSYDALSQILTPSQATLISRLNDDLVNDKDIVLSDHDKQIYQGLPAAVHTIFDKNHVAKSKIVAALKKINILPIEKSEEVAQRKQEESKPAYTWTSLFSDFIKKIYNKFSISTQSTFTTNAQ